MWEVIKKPFIWIKDQWNRFDAWVATWAPGVKTKIVAGLGAVGTGAVVLQEFISGIPANEFISAKTLGMVNVVLFVLAFWFRGMAKKD